MKIKFFVPFMLTCFTGFIACNTKEKKNDIKSHLELSAQPGGIIYLDTTPQIHISTTLFNPTIDTISLVTMTCSYENMFVTDTSTIKVQSRNDCYSNFPTVINIPPNSKLDQFIMVRPINKNIKAIDSKIRIGMYYIIPEKENGFKGIINQYENREKANILWSNEVELKRLYRKVYH